MRKTQNDRPAYGFKQWPVKPPAFGAGTVAKLVRRDHVKVENAGSTPAGAYPESQKLKAKSLSLKVQSFYYLPRQVLKLKTQAAKLFQILDLSFNPSVVGYVLNQAALSALFKIVIISDPGDEQPGEHINQKNEIRRN